MGSRIPFYFLPLNSNQKEIVSVPAERKKYKVWRVSPFIGNKALAMIICQFWHIVLFWIFLFSPIRWYIYFILTNYAHPADKSCFWTKNQSLSHRILQVKMETVTAWLSQENGRQPRTQGLHPSFVKQVFIVWSLRSLLGPKFYDFT